MSGLGEGGEGEVEVGSGEGGVHLCADARLTFGDDREEEGGHVDAALVEVLALEERRRALLAERGVDPETLAAPAARQAAWG